MSDTQFIIALGSAAADAERVGPKAANLAAMARAGLPTPGGFCLSADAYRRQLTHLGLDEPVANFAAADPSSQRRLSVAIRLKLYQEPLAPEILGPLLEAWHAQRQSGEPSAIRSSALIEDRADTSF